MTYAFYPPMNKSAIKTVIRTTVQRMGGRVTDYSADILVAKWRSPRMATLFPVKFAFYIGDRYVRAVTGKEEMQLIVMEFAPNGFQSFWDHFIVTLEKCYPGVDFGMRSGKASLSAVELLGDGTEQVFVSTTHHSPSLWGAIIGGELFGAAGAIIGGSLGESHTTTTAVTRFANTVLLRGCYSNGLLVEGRISRNTPLYNLILVNMRSFDPKNMEKRQ